MSNFGGKLRHPIIFGSVTDWNMQVMLGGQIFTTLLMYYYLKNCIKELGKDIDTILTQE